MWSISLLFGTLLITSNYGATYEVVEPETNSYGGDEPAGYAPDTNTYGGSEPITYGEPVTDSYGGQSTDTYAGEPVTDSYGGQSTDTYGGEPVTDSYGQPSTDTYGGEPVDSYGGQSTDTYGGEPVTDSYGAPATDSYAPVTDSYAPPTDSYTSPEPDYTTPTLNVIYSPIARTWADAQAYCQAQGSNLLTIAGGNFPAMQQCLQYAGNKAIVWTGVNKLGADGYGGPQEPWALVSGEPLVMNDAIQLSDGYSDGNCAYMNNMFVISNAGFQCDAEFAFCCDPVMETYPGSGGDAYAPVQQDAYSIPDDYTIPDDSSYSGGGSTGGSSSGVPTGGVGAANYDGPAPPNNVDSDCPRVRKEWNTATTEERQTYIEAILELSEQGILQKFVEQHGNMVSDRQAHGTSAFLPWHRAFLFEFENQIRALGGKFACSALLYWNWSKDLLDFGYQYSQWSILNSGLGSSGDPLDNNCVTDGAFAKGSYTPYYCELDDWKSTQSGECCLRRRTANDGYQSKMYGVRAMLLAIIDDAYYGIDKDVEVSYANGQRIESEVMDGIRDNLEKGPHDVTHCTIGSCSRYNGRDYRGHLGTSYSPDDPIFWLLHGFVDYAYALWQDFFQFEKMHKDYLTEAAYNGQATDRYRNYASISRIDDPLSFVILNQESFVGYINPTRTIRDTHSITEMGYQYHAGSFIPDSNIDDCRLSNEWFVGVTPDCSGERSSYTPGTSYTPPNIDPQDSYTQPQDSYSQPATDTYGEPADSYSQPQDSYSQPQDSYSQPQDSYSQPATDTYGEPQDSYSQPQDSYSQPQDSYSQPQDSYSQPQDSYSQPQDSYSAPVQDSYGAVFDPSYGEPVDSYSQPQDSYSSGVVSSNGGYSDGQTTDQILYGIVAAQYGERQYTIEGKQEMTATLAKMECEYMSSGVRACARPQFFYNCCDLPRNGNSYGNYPDIDVTYEQLVAWAPTECMKETRRAMFGWAQEFGSLYRLCRGDYDTFCDDDFLQGSYGDTCVTLEQYNAESGYDAVDTSYGGDSNSYAPPSDNSYGGDSNSYAPPSDNSYGGDSNSYAPPADNSYGGSEPDSNSYGGEEPVDAYARSGGLSIDQQPTTDNTAKFNQLEAMVLNGVINGIIFSIIIVLFMTIYVCYSKYYHRGAYDKVKYTENDVEH